MNKLDIQVGDKVIHWTYGLGKVLGVEERILSGRKQEYYAVKIRNMTVWVPIDDDIETRLRPPSSPRNFKALFPILKEPGDPLPVDRQERKLSLVERMKECQAKSLCCLIRDLSTFQQEHMLNENDQTMMNRACEALLSEWSFVLSIPPNEAELELHRMLAFGSSSLAV